MRIDLNADVGEGGDDLAILPFVSSVNIACGAHAGDPETMRRCVEEAARLGLAVGAHPGYPDRDGFGRRAFEIPDDALVDSLVSQIAALSSIAERVGAHLSHVKPHGALYNLAAEGREVALVVAGAVRAAGPHLLLVGLAGSALLGAAADAGLPCAGEGFADRRYRADGTLAPRSRPDALISDPADAARQALAMARREAIESIGGPPVLVAAETICLHADTPGATEIARTVRAVLERAGVEVAPLASR